MRTNASDFILPEHDSHPDCECPQCLPDPWADNRSEAEREADDRFDDLVQKRIDWHRADQTAKKRIAWQEQLDIEAPRPRSLADMLAEPDEDTPYLIGQVMPESGRVLLAAQKKVGKSTLIGGMIRSLVDGDPFLDAFTVNGTCNKVVLIDSELSTNTVRRWLRQQQIRNTDRVEVFALRGQLSAFNPLDSGSRARWAGMLRNLGADYLILDCLRPVLDSLGLDENRDAGKFLVPFEELLSEAGIDACTVVHHMGHTGERARGDSRLQDWPDALWKMVLKDPEDPASVRFFSAFGRDVDIGEGRLEFDKPSRRLAFHPGESRKAATAAVRADDRASRVVTILVENATNGVFELNTRAMIEAGRRHMMSNKAIGPALDKAVADGLVTVRSGPNRAKLYSLRNPCGVCHRPVTEPNRSTHPECSGTAT